MKTWIANIKKAIKRKWRAATKWTACKTASHVVLAEVAPGKVAVHYAKDEDDAREWASQYKYDDKVVCYHSLVGVPLSIAFERGI